MITVEDVRRWALALPETQEQEHWGRPSFRVGKKIFATLWPKEKRAVLKLTLEDQAALEFADPKTYSAGPWRRQGWTFVELETAQKGAFKHYLVLAWRQIAPKRAVKAYESQSGFPEK